MSENLMRVLPPGDNAPNSGGMGAWDEALKAGHVVAERADGTATQVGHVPPAIRKVNAQYEAVSMDEAAARMRKRQAGELPPIAGGIDGPGEVDPKKAKVSKEEAARMTEQYTGIKQNIAEHETDDPSVPPPAPDQTDLAPILKAALAQMAQTQAAPQPEVDVFNPPPAPVPQQPVAAPAPVAPPAPAPAPVMPAEVVQKASPADEYLAQRQRVGFTVAGGTYTVPAVDVLSNSVGLVILLPDDGQSATFVPSLGAEVAVEFNSQRWDCFFPGVAVHLEALGVQMLTFVYQNDKQG